MKKIVFLSMFLSAFTLAGLAQSDYKVVFDLTSKDSVDQKAVIRWLNEIFYISCKPCFNYQWLVLILDLDVAPSLMLL